MKKNKWLHLAPVPAILLSIVSVQGGAAIAKGLFPVMGSTGTAMIRMGLAAIILSTVYRPKLRQFSSGQWKAVIAYGITLGGMNMIFYLAIERIPLGLAVSLEFVGPLLLAVAGSRKASDFLWVLLAALGIALIAPWSGNGLNLNGIFLALLAGALWAAYIVLGGKVSQLLSGGEAVAVGMIFGSFTILPFAIASSAFENFIPTTIFAGAALAVLSSALPFTLEMSALKELPARTFSILMSLEPAVAALSGLIFLHEYLGFYEWLAVALVIIASAGAALTSKKVSAIPES
jgi:inner membrane transporter RhtA